jgi:hypothetical protein
VQQARVAAERTQTLNDMKQMGLALHTAHDALQRCPNNWDELTQYGLPGDVADRLKTAGVVFFTGHAIRDATGGTANSIYAFDAAAAQSGGPVVFMDGSARMMTAEEFNATLAAQKRDSPKTVAANSGNISI